MTRLASTLGYFLALSLSAFMFVGEACAEQKGAGPAKNQGPVTESTMKVLKGITYARVEGQDLQLDLYVPESSRKTQLDPKMADAKPPLVIWIHGGGWRAGSRNKPPIRRLVDHGYSIASISYRFTDDAVFPAQIHDCKAAVRFLRSEASRYGYDSDRIGVAGSSAGGYLALLVGVSCGAKDLEGSLGEHLEVSSCVDVIVDYFGPSDFVLRGRSQPEMAYSDQAGSYALLGGQNGKIDSELEASASPASYVGNQSPPLLVFHGAEDKRVLIDQSERMQELYRKHNRPVELVTVKGAGHGGLKFFMDENFQILVRFLDEHLVARETK